MPYITAMQTPRVHQITLEEILRGEVDVSLLTPDAGSVSGTVTTLRESIDAITVLKADIPRMIAALEAFNSKYAALFEGDRHSHYDSFYIPKRSGGLRLINAPRPDLMEALRELKKIFEEKMFALYHTAAFAYVKHRSALHAVKKHQANTSKWFEKTDFENFFGSTTPGFVLSMMSVIFPFSEIIASQQGKTALVRALDLCFLDGGLPQGTPISPMLTNLMMIPIDHTLYNSLRKKGFVYTRFADDIQISSRYQFDPQQMVREIDAVLDRFGAPFKIKPSKTRYGSSSGRNWNLGLMLNQHNQITVGYQKKKQFKAMCCNYIQDRKKGVLWDLNDVRALDGLRSYYMGIEREYFAHLIHGLNRKYSFNIIQRMRADLRGEP